MDPITRITITHILYEFLSLASFPDPFIFGKWLWSPRISFHLPFKGASRTHTYILYIYICFIIHHETIFINTCVLFYTTSIYMIHEIYCSWILVIYFHYMSTSEFRHFSMDKHVGLCSLGGTIGSRWYWGTEEGWIRGLFTTLGAIFSSKLRRVQPFMKAAVYQLPHLPLAQGSCFLNRVG